MAELTAEQDFTSSELGTQKYWDSAYARELQAFGEIGDVGEIWFGEEVQSRMVRWITKTSGLRPSSRILDLGTGNGMLLVALAEEDFSNLTGVDYSEAAIELSKKVAHKDGHEHIHFSVCDILSASSVDDLRADGQFQLCLDKGTYDAISLRDPADPSDRKLYASHVSRLLYDDGRLLITSCNWTKEQLVQHFHTEFDLISELPAPKFTFGGKTGQTVTSIVFKKRKNEEIG